MMRAAFEPDPQWPRDHVWPTRNILDVNVSTLDAAQTVSLLDELITDERTTAVAFLNANLSNLAAADPELTAGLQRALVLNDGIGIEIASRVLHGRKFSDNLNGTDFIPRYLMQSKHRLRIYLLGATAEANAGALTRFRRMTPQHQFIGGRDGYFNEEEREKILAEIKSLRPDVVLLAFGNPLQERLAIRHIGDIGCTLAICVGGLFDFISQRTPRAPAWVRGLRSEWLYRLWHDPGRLWRRYLFGNPWFLARVAAAKLRLSLRRGVSHGPEAKAEQKDRG